MVASKMVAFDLGHFADFEQVTIFKVIYWLWTGHIYFTDFEQVIYILLTLNRSKKTNSKTLWEKPDAYALLFFFRPLPHVTGTPPQLLRLRVSTGSELYPDTWLFFVFLNA